MIFYKDGGDSTVISPAEFKKIFGLNFSDFQKLTTEEALIARNIKFANAHCTVDPYDTEILQKINPIIRDNFIDMNQAATDAAYEI